MCTGTRELYRHFLRLPDGAIIEVFGDLATNEPRLQRKVQLTLQRSHIDLGKLLDRSTSFVNDSLDGEGSLRRGVVSRQSLRRGSAQSLSSRRRSGVFLEGGGLSSV
eukprot:m.228229 g.228229  ORF g.228229 m.228229 type:complete len:107 (+) comp10856_c0_seq12:9227-9547(+)